MLQLKKNVLSDDLWLQSSVSVGNKWLVIQCGSYPGKEGTMSNLSIGRWKKRCWPEKPGLGEEGACLEEGEGKAKPKASICRQMCAWGHKVNGSRQCYLSGGATLSYWTCECVHVCVGDCALTNKVLGVIVAFVLVDSCPQLIPLSSSLCPPLPSLLPTFISHGSLHHSFLSLASLFIPSLSPF